MKPSIRSLAVLLPTLVFISSIALLLGVTGVYFYSCQHAAHGANWIYVGTGNAGLMLRSSDFLRFAFTSAALWCSPPIRAVNAPADFVTVLISYAMAGKPFWWPQSLGPAVWDCLSFPLFAIPAWWYVGSEVDRLLRREPVRSTRAVTSTILVVTFGTVAAVLIFGLRGDPGLVPGYMAGFTLWTFLIAVPLVARLRQKFARQTD